MKSGAALKFRIRHTIKEHIFKNGSFTIMFTKCFGRMKTAGLENDRDLFWLAQVYGLKDYIAYQIGILNSK